MDPFIATLQKDFDGWGTVYDAAGLSAKVQETLDAEGFSPENSRLVFSVCPDDVNRLAKSRETVEDTLKKTYDGEFQLGNLAAYPISGVTGLGAASHHPPDDVGGGGRKQGNLIFLLSPHTGLSFRGDKIEYGKVLRPGQDHYTSSCGAAMGFLSGLKGAGSVEHMRLADDLGLDPTATVFQKALVNQYGPQLNALLKESDANKQVTELAKMNYALVRSTFDRMWDGFKANNHFDGKHAIIGGITVNTEQKDYFVLKEIAYK